VDVDLRDIEADLRRHQGDPQVRAKLAAARLRAAAPDPTSDPWPSLVARTAADPSARAPWATSARRVIARWGQWLAYVPCERDGSARCGTSRGGKVEPEAPRLVRVSAWRSWAAAGVEVLDHGDWLGGRPISRREHEPSAGDVIVYPGTTHAHFGLPLILVLGPVGRTNGTVPVVEARRFDGRPLEPAGIHSLLASPRGEPVRLGPHGFALGYVLGELSAAHYLAAAAGVRGLVVARDALGPEPTTHLTVAELRVFESVAADYNRLGCPRLARA